VLFDRDGTLIENVPLIDDPERVRLLPTARRAIACLRATQVRTGVATNQAAVGRGDTSSEDCDRVNARVDELLGPFDTWQVCRHTVEDGCGCHKPRPGMVLAACTEMGIPTDRCVLIGDTAIDVAAAESAGAVGVLVPNAQTWHEDVDGAAHVAADLAAAIDQVVNSLTNRLCGGPG
jgi:histidinol-phosphate phosphatase family protein